MAESVDLRADVEQLECDSEENIDVVSPLNLKIVMTVIRSSLVSIAYTRPFPAHQESVRFWERNFMFKRTKQRNKL